MDASTVITTAILAGVPLFNAGDAAASTAIYGNTIVDLVDLLDVVPSDLQPALSKTLDLSSAYAGNHERAWMMRHALDDVFSKLVTYASPSKSLSAQQLALQSTCAGFRGALLTIALWAGGRRRAWSLKQTAQLSSLGILLWRGEALRLRVFAPICRIKGLH